MSAHFTPANVALLLVLSLFFGLAFEEFYAHATPNRPGGIRTFPLLALAGATFWVLDPLHGFAFTAGLFAVGIWLYAYYTRSLRHAGADASESDFIILLCNVLAYGLGAAVLTQPSWVGVAITVAATLLLAARKELHFLASGVPSDEIFTAGKFLLLVGVIVPLLPDTPIAGFKTITPHKILLAVVAVSTLSYASYLVQRYLRVKNAPMVAGLLGGLYSSTATTVVLARRGHSGGAIRDVAVGIILATALMYVRLLLIVSIFDAQLGMALGPRFLALFGLSAVAAGVAYRLGRPEDPGDLTSASPSNPLQLTTALAFAALFVIVTLASNWASAHYGQKGIDVLAAVVGLTDIDPFVLSVSQGSVPGVTAGALAGAILIAAASNNVLKAAYTLGFGGRRMWLPATALLILGIATAAAALL